MKTVLLVDDDEDDRAVLVSVLESIDDTIHFKTAGDGLEALDVLQNDLLVFPDYIFLDLNMPKLNGFGFLRELRSITGLKTIPVVIYSTSSDEQDIRTCRELGADYFVTKPNQISEISRIVKSILSNHTESFLAIKTLRTPHRQTR